MDMLNMLVFLVGGGITLTAFIVFVGRLFPAPVTHSAGVIKTSLWKPFLIGLVNAVFFTAVAAFMFNFARDQLSGLFAGLVSLVALAILAALGVLGTLGLSGFSFWLEERLLGGEHSLTISLKSTLLLVLACMAPFVGWFLLTPFVIATGLGAAIQFVFRRKEKVV